MKPNVAYLVLNFAALEEADDLAVLGIGGIPYQSLGERTGAGFDDRMQSLAKGAIRFRHRGDLREHGGFPRPPCPAGGRGRLLRGLLCSALGGLLRALRVGSFVRSFLLRHQRLLSGDSPLADQVYDRRFAVELYRIFASEDGVVNLPSLRNEEPQQTGPSQSNS